MMYSVLNVVRSFCFVLFAEVLFFCHVKLVVVEHLEIGLELQKAENPCVYVYCLGRGGHHLVQEQSDDRLCFFIQTVETC